VGLDLRIVAEKRHRMKVEIEGLSGKRASSDPLMPQRQQALNLLRGDAGGIF